MIETRPNLARQFDRVASFELMREEELWLLVSLLIVKAADVPAAPAHGPDDLLHFRRSHRKIGSSCGVLPAAVRLKHDARRDVQERTDADAAEYDLVFTRNVNRDDTIRSDSRRAADILPSSCAGSGVVGFTGEVCGNGVDVTLRAAFMPRAILSGSPAARKWMNHTKGEKS